MMKFRTRSKSSKDSRGSFTAGKLKAEQYPQSPRAVAPTPPQHSSMDSRMFDHRKHSFEGKHISVPVSPGGLIYGDDERRQRSRSVGRHRSASVGRPQAARSRSSSRRRCRSPVSETNIRIVGRGEERVGRGFETYDQPRRRTQSTGRSSSRPPYDEDGESALFEEMDKPMRKSKMDKIRQLQAKNELYKEEFKRVQKDRKKLKKELEIKSNEITSLTREIDLHIEETSRLKVQLTEALMKIDQLDDSRDSTSVTRLSREMSQAKDDLAAALRRVSSLKDELADMQETIRRKDQQVESLSNEVATLQRSIAEVRNENKREGPPPEAVGDQNKMVSDLVEENNKLQEELGSTLERATTMVKEREEAIADLLKENDELKALLSDSVGNGENISSEVVENLQKELHRVTTTLEETQDRNLLLEEEVEAWLARGNEMEGVLDRLNQDVEMWQEKARTAESTAASLEGQVVDAKADASSAREALRDAEARHKADLEQLKAKHEAEMRDLHERAFAERVEKQSTESPQAMLLQQAVADQMMKKAKPSSWRKFLKAGDEDESLDDNQKRIKELEAQNAEREEEIKSLKSELVRLRSSYNEAAYVSKKQIDQLTDENEAYAQKVKSMEELLSSGTG